MGNKKRRLFSFHLSYRNSYKKWNEYSWSFTSRENVMIIKFLKAIMIFLVTSFIFLIFKYYLSNENLTEKNYKRQNINEILKEKISDLPVLLNDTDNVIEFNNSIEDNISEKKRSFWDLLKNR